MPNFQQTTLGSSSAFSVRRRAEHRTAASALAGRNLFWLLGAIFVPFACQLALCIDAFASGRVIIRTAAFLFSFVAFVRLFSKPHIFKGYPLRKFAVAIIVILVFSLSHPFTASLLGGMATIGFYFSILSPIFWVSKLSINSSILRLIAWSVFLFNAVSAGFGVLQIYYPGRFQPALSDVVKNSVFGVEMFSIVLADGTETIRPMGLTDMPGGAGVAGLQAFIFGMAIYLCEKRTTRYLGMVGCGIGLFCIYLSQIRSLLILTAVMFIGCILALFLNRERLMATRLLIFGTILFVSTFAWALSVGGEQTRYRFESLLAGSASEVYYQNRGSFLEYTFTKVVPEFPLGAGLARWGMMSYYFGRDSTVPPLWAEIQWTGWVYDGGVPLMVLYFVAALIASKLTFEIACKRTDPWLSRFAMVIFGFNVSVLMQTFGSVPFLSQIGLQFWFLNAVVYVANNQNKPANKAC